MTLDQLMQLLEGASTAKEVCRRMIEAGHGGAANLAPARQACGRLGLSPTEGTLRNNLKPSRHTEARAEGQRAMSKEWYENGGRERQRETKKKWYDNGGRERQRETEKKWYENGGRERKRETEKKWYENGGGRKKRTVYYSRRRREDPVYRLEGNLRGRVIKAVRGASKSARTMELVGCSVDDLRAHLEAQFRPGMTWANYGSGWHVDHVRPCASFDLSDPEEQRRCFHWSNLQPMWAGENLSKGSLFEGERRRRK